VLIIVFHDPYERTIDTRIVSRETYFRRTVIRSTLGVPKNSSALKTQENYMYCRKGVADYIAKLLAHRFLSTSENRKQYRILQTRCNRFRLFRREQTDAIHLEKRDGISSAIPRTRFRIDEQT